MYNTLLGITVGVKVSKILSRVYNMATWIKEICIHSESKA